MPSVTALRRWLVFVACLRLFSVGLGYAAPHRFQINLYSKQPELVTDLTGRTFAAWTLTTCLLCLVCARNPCVPSIYGATLLSFIVAIVHFVLELFVFQTISLFNALQPLAIAGVSTLWMAAGWNYYTSYAVRMEPTISEDVTVTKDD